MVLHSIFKNTIFLLIVQVANPLTSFILIVVMSRTLGVEGLGAYAFVLAVQMVSSTTASLGLNTPLTRIVSQQKSEANRYLSNGILIGMSSATGMLLLVNLVTVALGYSREIVYSVNIASVSIYPTIGILYLEAVFLAYERAEYIAGLSMLENILRVFIGLVLIRMGYGIFSFFLLITILKFILFLSEIAMLNRYIFPLKWMPDSESRRVLMNCMPTFFGIVFLNSVFSRIDTFFLSRCQSMYEVGIYDAAFRILFIYMTVPYSLSRSFYPAMSQAAIDSATALEETYAKCVEWVAILIIPISIGTFAIAESTIDIVYGSRYSDSTTVLRILMLGLFPAAIMRVNASILFSTERQSVDLKINLIALLVGICLNAVLIPKWSFLGAALATTTSFYLYAGLQQLCISRYTNISSFIIAVWRPLLSGCVMGVCVWPLRMMFLGIPIVVGTVIYVTLLICMGAISRDKVATLLTQRILHTSTPNI